MVYIIAILAGLIDGILEGYGFDGRKSFERKLKVNPKSYFGSESWRMIYVNGNPDEGVKSKFHYWLGASDFYHHADDARKALYLLTGILAATTNLMLDNIWLNFLIIYVLSGFAKSLGMKWIRK